MKVKMILPALTEATSPFWRPVKYSLFPPLGLATLAAYLADDDEIEIQDEHVEALDLSDTPDLVVIQVYITSARRAYQLADHYRARGAHVALGGLHVTSLPDEAMAHADTIFLGPGEDTWPRFLGDFRRGSPERVYRSTNRTLTRVPPIRRDLIKRRLYLVQNSIVVSRGCPHVCDFCYKEAFFEGGRSFYTQTVDAALAEIERLPGRHLYFLDDHLFGDRRFASGLFDGMRGMGRLWQAAGTVNAVLAPGLLERAAEAGLRSLFVGFETLNPENLVEQRKYQNMRRDYAAAIRRLHGLGVMINGSFVFGMDGDNAAVFERTWSGRLSRASRPPRSISSRRTQARRCTAASRNKVASRPTTGTSTTRVMRSSGRRACRLRNSNAAISGPIVSSIGGRRSSAAPRRTTIPWPGCAMSRVRPAGRSSSRYGTS